VGPNKTNVVTVPAAFVTSTIVETVPYSIGLVLYRPVNRPVEEEEDLSSLNTSPVEDDPIDSAERRERKGMGLSCGLGGGKGKTYVHRP
jgi:hypothetical protein